MNAPKSKRDAIMNNPKISIRYTMEECPDAYPDTSYLEQFYDDCEPAEAAKYRAQDAARLSAYYRWDWCYVGIRARADITVTRPGYSVTYTLHSAGLWGIESDSSAEYFAEVFKDQCEELAADIEAIRTGRIES